MRKVPELRFAGFDGEWEEKKLKETSKIVGGGTPSTKNEEYWDGDINWFTPSEIDSRRYFSSSERKITEKALSKSSAKLLDKNKTVLFTSRATIGEVGLLKEDSTTNQGFQSLVIKDNFDLNFMYSIAQTLKRKALSLSVGSTFKEISKSSFEDIEIYTPIKNEQEKIGNLFRKIDNLIEIQEGKVAKLEDFKKSMLQKMFPKKGKLVPEFRFDGFDNYGFDKGKINDFIVTHGSKNYIKQPEDVGTYKVIQQGDIPIAGYSNEDPYKDFSNVILFGDHTLSLFKPYEPFLLSTDGIKIMFIENIDREYFYYLVQHVMPKSQGYKRHYKILRAVKVNIPKSYKEQQKIGQFFKNLDSQIEAEEKLLESYKMMKKSLLQKMFV